MSKNANLSLSTNAIVILILAITILGLGLTFVRGLFKEAESKIREVTSSTELAVPPTTDHPLTLAPSQVTLRQKEQKKVSLAFLNNAGQRKCKLSVLKGGTEEIMGANSDAKLVIYNKEVVTIKEDAINVWTLAVDGQKKADGEGTMVLTASMCCGGNPSGTDCTGTDEAQYTRDLIVTVTS